MPPTRRARSRPPADVLPAASPRAPERVTVQRADLHCYLCAETCGALEAAPTGPIPPVARFYAVDGSPGRMLAWQMLRCPRCGGRSLFVDEPELIVHRVERIDWTLEQPRRGRPPGWLVKLRNRQDAA